MRKFLFKVLVVLFVFGGWTDGFGQSLDWAFQIGENDGDYGAAIDVDKNGNVFSTGYFEGNVDFDPGPLVDMHLAIGKNYYIQKLNPNGDLIWAFTPGNPIGNSFGTAIKVDTFGNVYTCGFFQNNVDFDPDTSSYNLISNGFHDVFIQKLDSNGNLLWAHNFGSINADKSSTIDLDEMGNVYLSGTFNDTVDFNPDTLVSNILISDNSTPDVFILKLNSNGDYVWAKRVGGSSFDWVNSLKIDNIGNVCLTGRFSGTVDFDPGIGADFFTATGNNAVFILKLNTNGDYIWAKSIDAYTSNSLSTCSNEDIVICGSYSNTVDFDPGNGVYNLTSNGGVSNDIFVLKLNQHGSFVWAKSMGGPSSDIATSTYIDINEAIYLTGDFSGIGDFDPGSGIELLTASTLGGIFIEKLDSSGNMVWAKSIDGGIGTGTSIVGDKNKNIYVTGDFKDTADFDINYGEYLLNGPLGTLPNIFIQKLNYCVNTFSIIDTVSCVSYISPSNKILVSSGIYFDTISNVLGCDSIITIDLTISNPSSGAEIQSACNVYTWIDGNTYTSNNNTATFTLTNATGCDSIITLDLTILNSSFSTDIQTACDTYTWIDGNIYTTNNNTATHTLTNATGCDSIVTLDLTIENATTGLDVQSAPSPFTWIDGNTYTTDNNTATETLVNAAGCDSVVTLNLTIIDTIIQGNIMTSLGNPLQNSKVYLIKYYASQDSVFATDSTFTNAVGFYEFPNTFQNAYVKAIPDVANYPNEIPTYNLSSAIFQNADAVYLSYPFGNTDFATIAGVNPGGNGFIGGIVGNGAGKNSEVGELLPNISLVLMNTNDEVVAQTITDINGHFEFDNIAEETYSLWVDKAGILNNLAPSISLAADNNQDNLQFILHKTYLENVTSVGIKNISQSHFNIFPNPTNQVLTIQNLETTEKYTVELYSVLGEQVYVKTSKKESLNIDLEKLNLSKGTYFVKIATEQGNFVSKVIYR